MGIDAGPVHIDLSEVLSKTEEQDIFLKIDIEGPEYRILDQILASEHRLTGLAIEFHDCDLWLDQITNLLKKSSLEIAHVHANNFGPITKEGVPVSIELTMTSNRIASKTIKQIPHRLDKPNNPLKLDIILHFS